MCFIHTLTNVPARTHHHLVIIDDDHRTHRGVFAFFIMAQDPSQAARVRKLLIAGTITAKPAMTATPAAPAHNTEIGPTAPPAVRPVSKVKPVIRPQSSLPLVRHAGGQQWVDPTLKDFPASTWCDGDDDDDETDDFRLFVGDLGPECTDQMMVDAFRKYSSFLYARAVRDKKYVMVVVLLSYIRELSCKGYGFVSFADVNDYVKAYREMNGKV